MTQTIQEILSKRKEVIEKHVELQPNYFDWKRLLELDKYSTYITITPRSIGKTYSAMEIALETFIATGEYTVWMRTTLEEIKEVLDDYKTNPPHPLLVGETSAFEWQGKNIICKETGRLVVKFVALSTVHNLASITGSGCAFIIYDEFLPRTNRRLPRAYHKLTDFIKTIERNNLVTILLQANSTTLNSDILMNWDLWNDIDEKDDEERRLRYRYFREWSNPPKVEKVSTASVWASNTADLSDFMDKATFLDDGDGGMVLPESRLGNLRHYYQYRLDKVIFTMSLTDDDKWVILEGPRDPELPIYALTTTDGYTSDGNTARPMDLKLFLGSLTHALEIGNCVFTSYEIKESVFKYLQSLNGKMIKSTI